MSQVSRRPIKKETEKKINELFQESITLCSSKPQVEEFIEDLLTPTEKIMLSKRLAIAYLLLRDYSYSMIKTTLKVSTPTIGSISLLLKHKGNGIRKIVKLIEARKKWRNFLEDLGDSTIDLFGSSKGSNWKATKSYLYHRKLAKQSPL